MIRFVGIEYDESSVLYYEYCKLFFKLIGIYTFNCQRTTSVPFDLKIHLSKEEKNLDSEEFILCQNWSSFFEGFLKVIQKIDYQNHSKSFFVFVFFLL